ncbi:MAG TPA: hypothetical protein VK835_09515 [Bacteroidia bacterium]|jgi:hypothetical protein|nr:hypothetical protein [Bacteroidia bacterium]
MLQKQKYLIIKACAGLGNRLVTVFAAIKYCEINNRILVIDWNDGQFDKKGTNAFKKCFELKHIQSEEVENIEHWSEYSHSSQLFKQHKSEGVYDLYVNVQPNFWGQLPNKLFVFSWLKKLRRRWQPIKDGNYFNSLNSGSDLPNNMDEQILYYVDFLPYINYEDLPKYLGLKPFIIEKIEIFTKQNNLNNAVGIHIRNTDKRPTTDVQKVIDRITVKHKDSPVYLSTDSTEIEAMFVKNVSNLILFPKEKPKLNGEGLHQWALHNDPEEKLKYILFEESVVEMFLLSKCQYLYYQGNSTFSNISKVYHPNKTNCYDWLKL